MIKSPKPRRTQEQRRKSPVPKTGAWSSGCGALTGGKSWRTPPRPHLASSPHHVCPQWLQHTRTRPPARQGHTFPPHPPSPAGGACGLQSPGAWDRWAALPGPAQGWLQGPSGLPVPGPGCTKVPYYRGVQLQTQTPSHPPPACWRLPAITRSQNCCLACLSGPDRMQMADSQGHFQQAPVHVNQKLSCV